MFQQGLRFTTIALFLFLYSVSVRASAFSSSPAGANALFLRLPDGSVATGAGINLGQVEIGRPPKDGQDADHYLNSQVNPFEVYYRNAPADPNAYLSEHATWVAGVGVAPGAVLYSSAFEVTGTTAGQSEALQSIQRIATLPSTGPAHTRAIVNSWGATGSPNGNSNLTRGVDWLASKRDVLLVFAGDEEPSAPIPLDNFNGITVAASSLKDGFFRKVWEDVTVQPNEVLVLRHSSILGLAAGR